MISIRRYQLLVILSIITLIAFFAALKGYSASMERAEQLFDGQLKSLANALIIIETKDKSIGTGQHSEFAFQIWKNKQLFLHSDNTPRTAIKNFNEGFSDINFSGKRWRSFSYTDEVNDKWIIVAQPIATRFELAEEMTLAAVSPLVFSIPLIALFISFAVKRSLKPINQLSQLLNAKQAKDLTPISIERNSKELMPITDTLNDLLLRLGDAFTREQRFAADVAHELRTPISVVKVNAHNLKNECDKLMINNQDTEVNFADLEQGIDRLASVVEQILLLNKTNHEHLSVHFSQLNLQRLGQEVISEIYNEIDQQQQSIELDADQLFINGDEVSLKIALQNLILNASKYAGRKCHIKVTVKELAGLLHLSVEDTGPGIEASELPKVLQRFYRGESLLQQSTIKGSGLGLSIVKQIANLHNAKLELAASQDLGGLKATLVFKHFIAGEQ
ncbi:MAG: ATP-binding protein [Thalassotalea sp.]|nr:ATP-binding protein [Thalassotalea sp.]MDG2393141.1 ATP-binding protein [Thalassotalea sp.]